MAPRETALTLVLIALVACGAPDAAVTSLRVATTIPVTPAPVVAFPQQAPTPGPRTMLAALVDGTLVLVDGCLRVRRANGTSDLVIWPPEVALRTDGGAIQIVDAGGRVAARVGAPIAMGGGQLSTVPSHGLREAPPARCPGPYWLTGEIARATPLPAATRTPLAVANPADALDRDAAAYAAAHGVDLPEAKRRLQRQDAIGKLGAALATGERATFAGLQVQHQPHYRIIVWFTRDGERTIQPYIAGGPLADLVEARMARWTLADLEAARAEALRLVQPLGVPVDTRLDVPGNRVALYVVDRARLDAAIHRSAIRLPDSVVVLTVDRLARQVPWL